MALNITQVVKNLSAIWETEIWSLGGEDPLKKGKATHSSILAWRIPQTIYSPWGCKESDTAEWLSLHFTSNGKWQLLGKCLWTFTVRTVYWWAVLIGKIGWSLQKTKRRDVPSGPEVENPPCNAADLGLTPGRGTRILPALEKKLSYWGNCSDHVQQLRPDTVKK